MFDLLLFFFLSLFPIVIYCHGNYPYDVYRDLQRESDVVVEGRVDQVFSTREKLVDDQDKDKLLKQYNLIQIFVEKVHKGEVATNKVLYAHSWNVFHAPIGCNEPDRGQRMIARIGDQVQLFLKQDAKDQSLHAINPNGLEILSKISSKL